MVWVPETNTVLHGFTLNYESSYSWTPFPNFGQFCCYHLGLQNLSTAICRTVVIVQAKKWEVALLYNFGQLTIELWFNNNRRPLPAV
jgi:hypothetical protein